MNFDEISTFKNYVIFFLKDDKNFIMSIYGRSLENLKERSPNVFSRQNNNNNNNGNNNNSNNNRNGKKK